MRPVNCPSQYFDNNAISLYLKPLGSVKSLSPMAGQIVRSFLNAPLYADSDVESYYEMLENVRTIDKEQYGIEDIGSEWLALLDRERLAFSEYAISKGYDAGIIDLKESAILKLESGWYDHNGKFIVSQNASFDEIKSYVESIAPVIPCFDGQQIDEFISKGVVQHGHTLIASRDDYGRWVIHNPDRSVSFDDENPRDALIRVLCHSSFRCYVIDSNEFEWFHGTTSRDSEPDMLQGSPKGFSRQGKALYCTSSLDEAINIYSNQFTAEVMSKRNQDSGETFYNLTDKHSFVYKVTNKEANLHFSNGNCLDRISHKNDLFEKSAFVSLTINDIPSPFLMMLIAQKNEIESNVLLRTMNNLYKSASPYDVYMSLNELTDASPSKNVLQLAASAMGLSGFAVKFPSNDMTKKLNDLKENDEFHKLFKGRFTGRDLIDGYLKKISDSRPAKAQDAHLLCFDRSFNVESVVKLPAHKRILTKQCNNFDSNDGFYGNEGHKLELINKDARKNDPHLALIC